MVNQVSRGTYAVRRVLPPDPCSAARHRPWSDDGATILNADGTRIENNIMRPDGDSLQGVAVITLLIFTIAYFFRPPPKSFLIGPTLWPSLP